MKYKYLHKFKIYKKMNKEKTNRNGYIDMKVNTTALTISG